ncbi:AAA family ATPase [Myxococcota bacterium]|nr:AAA family ATPase [Myxococcota bacterium]
MITEIHVENFRVLRDVRCTFERFTVLVGPNGAGKSTLLRALSRAAHNLIHGRVRAEILGPGLASLSVEVSSDENADPLDRALELHLVPAALRAGSALEATVGPLTGDGSGLAALLADMKLNDDPRLERITSALSTVVPAVRSIKVVRSPPMYQLSFELTSGRIVPAADMSDGTMHALGVIAALESAGGQRALVLIDDLDQGLHPRAQGDIVSCLRGILDAQPSLQIVATTHSPYLLDFFRPEEVRLMTLGDDGFARVARLTDHPEFERWKDVMAPGELWSALGEDWVAGRSAPVPSPERAAG